MKVGADDFIVNGGTKEDFEALPRVESTAGPWPELGKEAFHGIAGRIVQAAEPHSESDPVAILVTFLVGVGNMLGPDVFAMAGEDVHPLRLNALLVGASAMGRKGSSKGVPLRVLRAVDTAWGAQCIHNGLSSGEGLIAHVRDPHEKRVTIREKGRAVGFEYEVDDEGAKDKRALIIETEFATVLRRMEQSGNTLSMVLRQAWEDGRLQTLTVNGRCATGAHISVLGHITPEELKVRLSRAELEGGFMNRFLPHVVRRVREIPSPQRLPDHVLQPLVDELYEVVAFVRESTPRLIRRDPQIEQDWGTVYHDLVVMAEMAMGSLAGKATSRSAPQILRLSALYAALDRSSLIRSAHLAAALAIWDHAVASAQRIFGRLVGNPIADRIIVALRERGPLTRTDIRDLFHRNVTADKIEAALHVLEITGQATKTPGTAFEAPETWTART